MTSISGTDLFSSETRSVPFCDCNTHLSPVEGRDGAPGSWCNKRYYIEARPIAAAPSSRAARDTSLNRISAQTTQRRQLIDFLKGCRARLTPTQVGLPDTNRRRTPGLRREDVAALAGVSVTWYTWLEQGRDIQVSADVLERISTTLRMSADEREYLFALVQHRPAPPTQTGTETVSPSIKRM